MVKKYTTIWRALIAVLALCFGLLSLSAEPSMVKSNNRQLPLKLAERGSFHNQLEDEISGILTFMFIEPNNSTEPATINYSLTDEKGNRYKLKFSESSRRSDRELVDLSGTRVTVSGRMTLDRDSKDVNAAIVNKVFGMTKPTEGGTSFDGVVLPNGNYAIIALSKVIEGDPSTVKKEERENIKRELMNAAAVNSQEYLLSTLRKGASIRIQEEDL